MALVLKIVSLGMALSLGAPLWAKEARVHQVKAESLQYLQELRVQNVKRLRDIDDTLRTRIENSPPNNIEKEVNQLKTAKHEHVLRQEFLDRLIFQIDTKFAGGDLRQFLERALTEMAKIDAVSSQANTGLWKFLKFSADAVRRLPEQKENILSFLEGYMNRSVSDPIRPDEYLNSRNYTNGSNSESGRPLHRDEVGAVADRRLQEMQATVELPDGATPASGPSLSH